MRRKLLAAGLLAAGLASAAEAPGAVTADHAWARAPAGAGGMMAVYFTLHGGAAPDRLAAVTVDVAGMAMLHESGETGGVSTMRMLDGVDIPAGGTVVLRPGGMHVMLEDLSRRPVPGETVHARLRFEHAPAIELPVVVRPPGAAGP